MRICSTSSCTTGLRAGHGNDRRTACAGSLRSSAAVLSTRSASGTGVSCGSRGRAKTSRSWTMSLSESTRATTSPMIGAVAAVRRHAAADHLQRPLDRGERVLDLVRDHRGHLAEACQRRLLAQLLLRPLAIGDVVADRHVLVRPAALVEERHDRRVHPVDRSVLGAVAQLAAPDAAVGDRVPQIADELLRVVAGVDDAMIRPSSSSRGYFEISTNLSLTKVISPLTFVVATIAAWLSAKFVSARSLTDRSSALPGLRRNWVTSHAVTQMPTIVSARLMTA